MYITQNKANLRDLIAATDPVILLKSVRIHDFFSVRFTFKFDGWPRKTIGHVFHAPPSFVHHFVVVCKLKLELQSVNAQFGANLFWPLLPWHLTSDLDFCMDFTSVNGNNSWKLYDYMVTGTLKWCQRETGGQTFLELFGRSSKYMKFVLQMENSAGTDTWLICSELVLYILMYL